jgi:hypothetical protein
MPSFNVAIWNIQNFGADSPDHRGTNSRLQAGVIQVFVRQWDLDVLAILEVLPGALPALRTLLETLNQGLPNGDDDWCFDWVKGSIANGVDSPHNADELTWEGGPAAPRREGYAIFWRANRAAFNMVPAFRDLSEGAWRSGRWDPLNGNGHFVELILKGRPFVWYDDSHWGTDGAYNPATSALFPLDNTGAVLPTWPNLDFPWVSVGRFSEPRRDQSRRPALMLADLHNGGNDAARLCPIIPFHAPSNANRAQMGTILASLARECNVCHSLLLNGRQNPAGFVHNAKFIAGGDYNVNARHGQDADWYVLFTNAYSNLTNSGNAATSVLDLTDPAKTTVQIRLPSHGHYSGASIETNNPDDYKFTSIDQAFYRNLVAHGAGIYNFMEAIMENNTPYRASIRAYGPMFDRIIRQSGRRPDRDLGPEGPVFPVYGVNFTNWTDFYRDVNRGRFTTARSAAEFLRIFISDHLPLVLPFQW